MTDGPRIVQAGHADIETVRALFLEYAEWLGFSLRFQGFDEELVSLPGKYVPPAGRLMLALDGGGPVGVVALRPHDAETAELKRLYVRPSARGTGVGRSLVEAALAGAREAGYRRVVLDTIGEKMAEAVALYRAFGFVEIAPYYDNPVPGALYLALDLGQ